MIPLVCLSLSRASRQVWNYDLKINLASNFNSEVSLTPPPPETPSLLEFSVPPSVQSEVQRLVYRPLRLQSQDTPNAGRILDLDRGSMSSVVSRLSGRGQVSFMELSIC